MMPSSGLPVFARANGESSIASYDWLDITSGCGYRTYYPTKTNSASPAPILTVRKIDGGAECWYQHDAATVQAEAATLSDTDFDITMRVPSIIGGVSYMNFSHDVTGTPAQILHRYFVITIYHVLAVAGTETSLGTATTLDWTSSDLPIRESVSFDLTSHKFAIGDKLRFNVISKGSATAGGTYVEYYFDPNSLKTLTDSESRTIGTDFTLDVPFKIDI